MHILFVLRVSGGGGPRGGCAAVYRGLEGNDVALTFPPSLPCDENATVCLLGPSVLIIAWICRLELFYSLPGRQYQWTEPRVCLSC